MLDLLEIWSNKMAICHFPSCIQCKWENVEIGTRDISTFEYTFVAVLLGLRRPLKCFDFERRMRTFFIIRSVSHELYPHRDKMYNISDSRNGTTKFYCIRNFRITLYRKSHVSTDEFFSRALSHLPLISAYFV